MLTGDQRQRRRNRSDQHRLVGTIGDAAASAGASPEPATAPKFRWRAFVPSYGGQVRWRIVGASEGGSFGARVGGAPEGRDIETRHPSGEAPKTRRRRHGRRGHSGAEAAASLAPTMRQRTGRRSWGREGAAELGRRSRFRGRTGGGGGIADRPDRTVLIGTVAFFDVDLRSAEPQPVTGSNLN